jgi:hypothetical protein
MATGGEAGFYYMSMTLYDHLKLPTEFLDNVLFQKADSLCHYFAPEQFYPAQFNLNLRINAGYHPM